MHTTPSVNKILTDSRYSTVTVNKNNINNSNSTVEPVDILRNLTDVIPDDGYYPFYLKQFRKLGKDRFMYLVGLARKSSDTPQRLFCWLLKNNEVVK